MTHTTPPAQPPAQPATAPRQPQLDLRLAAHGGPRAAGPSPRLRAALAPFGLAPRAPALAPPETAPHLPSLLALPPGRCALVTGASGSGKSRLLAALAVEVRATRVCCTDARPATASGTLADLHPHAPLADWLDTLAAAGLAEADLLRRTPTRLSTGERARLALASGMLACRAARASWLIIDELGSALDPVTAAAVARGVSRWARRTGVRVVAAGRPDLRSPLGAAVVALPPRGVRGPGPPPASPRLGIEPGCYDDYQALAGLHYLAGKPATVVGVLRAKGLAGLAGVLVISMPTRTGVWRRPAWGDRYLGATPAERKAAVARLNAEVRCISRVIVAPPWRGLGVATRLVRAYLADAQTPRTEAVAAMGALSPFFERAGMTRHDPPERAADERYLAALTEPGAPLHAERARWRRSRRLGITAPDPDPAAPRPIAYTHEHEWRCS